MYKISIITINYNNAFGLRQTIESVIDNKYGAVQYIVIDGGSSDNSISIIKKFAGEIDYWESNADRGIYHAMNKGIAKATGDYLLFLNSGDYFSCADSLNNLARVIQPDLDIIYGDIIVKETEKEWVKTYPEELTFGYFLQDALPHPSTLIKRSLFEIIGPYNEQNKIVSDWEFFLHAICKYNARYLHVSFPVTTFNFNGISSKETNTSLITEEKNKILAFNYPAFLPDYLKSGHNEQKLDAILNSRMYAWMSKIKRAVKTKNKA